MTLNQISYTLDLILETLLYIWSSRKITLSGFFGFWRKSIMSKICFSFLLNLSTPFYIWYHSLLVYTFIFISVDCAHFVWITQSIYLFHIFIRCVNVLLKNPVWVVVTLMQVRNHCFEFAYCYVGIGFIGSFLLVSEKSLKKPK